MKYFLLVLSVVFATADSIFVNKFSKSLQKNFTDICVFECGVCAVAGLELFIMNLVSGGSYSPSVFTIVLGAVFGVVIASAQILNPKALETGPMSYTNLIGLCGMILPTFSGKIFWGEDITAAQYVGIALMLLSFVLGVNPKKDKRMSVKWIIMCALIFVLNGGMGIIQKIDQTSDYAEETTQCLVTAFITATLILLASALIQHRRTPRTVSFKSMVPVLAAATGIGTGAVHIINMYLVGVMNSAFFFPAVNGATIMAITLASVFVFREKLSKIQIFSLVLGTLAILLVGNVTDLFIK